jgi:hypothetical protein
MRLIRTATLEQAQVCVFVLAKRFTWKNQAKENTRILNKSGCSMFVAICKSGRL